MNVSQPGNAEADERRISEFVTNRCTKLSKRGKKKEKKERQQEEQVKIKKKARSLSMHPLFTFNAPCTSRKWRADSAAAVRECTEDFGALSFYLFIFYLFIFFLSFPHTRAVSIVVSGYCASVARAGTASEIRRK